MYTMSALTFPRVQAIPVFRVLHVYQEMMHAKGECGTTETCELRNETSEVWLDHLDELSSIPRRGFHSAFQEGDAGGSLGMGPWSTIYEGISRGTSRAFTLMFVFGGMQMTAVDKSDMNVLAMDGSVCANANLRVLNEFRRNAESPALVDVPHLVQQQPWQPSSQDKLQQRVLVISRNGTWWRRWLNEKVIQKSF